MRWMRAHLTYANTAATLALVVAMGGGTYAVAGQLAAQKTIKACVTKSGDAKGAVRIAKKCKSHEKSLSWNQTGVAGPTGPSGSPDTGAQVLGKLATVDGAGSGLDADTLDGLSNDVWHTVGAGGEPAFQNGWVNFGSGQTDASFTKDATGVVHIRGQVAGGTVNPGVTGSVFTLPVGYRPPSLVYVAALTTNGANVVTPGYVGVSPTGDVIVGVGNNAFVALDMSFRP
jgi:hypothetical protein